MIELHQQEIHLPYLSIPVCSLRSKGTNLAGFLHKYPWLDPTFLYLHHKSQNLESVFAQNLPLELSRSQKACCFGFSRFHSVNDFRMNFAQSDLPRP